MNQNLQKKYSELAFMQAQYAISVTDLEGSVLAVNKAYVKLYSLNHESDIIGKKQSVIKSSGVPRETYVDMWKTIKKGEIWRGDLINQAVTGEKIPVNLSIHPIFENGKQVAYMSFTIDRTQMVELEHQLLHSNKLAVLGTLGASLAHELNNPLTSLSLEAENLDELLDEREFNKIEGKKSVKTILKGVGRMKRVLNHLLLFVHKDDSQRKEIFSAKEMIEDSLLFLSRQLQNRGIDVILNLKMDLTIHGVRTDVESVIHNIISNAKHAFEENKVQRAALVLTAKQLDEDWIEVKILDNAGGIPEDVVGRIFEPFFTTKKEGQGTGLGLSISRKIIRETGGEISCKTWDGFTEFRILLPLSKQNKQSLFLD